MTTMSGQGACVNAGPVARLQAELETVEGELEVVTAAYARLFANFGNVMAERAIAMRERDEARALVPETLVCW